MAHTPHELAEEFPHHIDQLHRLKTTDAHFAKLAEEYHALNREIHRAEAEIEPTSDDHLDAMKTLRVRLKDNIYAHLRRGA